MSGKKKKKTKKLASHRFEDRVKDYARTNSQVTDENARRVAETGADKGWKAPLNKTEKVMVVIGVLAVIGIIIKYFIAGGIFK